MAFKITSGWLSSAAAAGFIMASSLGNTAPTAIHEIPPGNGPQWGPWSEPVRLDINWAGQDLGASLTKDGKSLYYAAGRPGGFGREDIWVSKRADLNSPFGEPVNLGPVVNTPNLESVPRVSRDGHWLFFESVRPGFGGRDLFVSWRADVHDDFAWGPPTNLGSGVNTASFEGGAAYFENDAESDCDDGDGECSGGAGPAQLYLHRAPVNAAADTRILVSELGPDGSWGLAVEVAELNSQVNDFGPAISFNGREMYFTSSRGGSTDDIWHSSRLNAFHDWSPPVLLGAPINTPDQFEILPYIWSHGSQQVLLFSRGAAVFGPFDIYMAIRHK